MASLFTSLQRSLKGLLILVPVLIGLVMVSPAEAARWDAETLTVPGNPISPDDLLKEAQAIFPNTVLAKDFLSLDVKPCCNSS